MTAPGVLQFDPATAKNAFWTDIGLVVPRISSSVHAHGNIVSVQSTTIPPVIDRMNRHTLTFYLVVLKLESVLVCSTILGGSNNAELILCLITEMPPTIW